MVPLILKSSMCVAFGEEHDWGGGCPVKCILIIHAELGIASSFVVAAMREQASIESR